MNWNKYGKEKGISGDTYKMIFEKHIHIGETSYIKTKDVIDIIKKLQNEYKRKPKRQKI